MKEITADHLRAMRLSANKTQAEMAAQVKIRTKTYENYENGVSPNIKLNHFLAWMKFCKLDSGTNLLTILEDCKNRVEASGQVRVRSK